MAQLDPEERDALTKSRAAIRALRKAGETIDLAATWWPDVNTCLFSEFNSAASDIREQANALESELDSVYPRRTKSRRDA